MIPHCCCLTADGGLVCQFSILPSIEIILYLRILVVVPTDNGRHSSVFEINGGYCDASVRVNRPVA